MASPNLRASQPIPPPSVSPEMPTEPVSPNGVARPWAAAATVYSPAVRPGSAQARRCSGSMMEALHRAEVEHDAAVVRAVTGEAVAAAADRQRETGFARQGHRPRDVGRIGGTDDERRVTVVDRRLDAARLVVLRAAGQEDRAGQPGLEGFEVEGVVDVGAIDAEGFHALGLLGVSDASGGVPASSPRPRATRLPTAVGSPAWTSVASDRPRRADGRAVRTPGVSRASGAPRPRPRRRSGRRRRGSRPGRPPGRRRLPRSPRRPRIRDRARSGRSR